MSKVYFCGVLGRIIAKKKRSKIRVIMRGYRQLKKQNNLNAIKNIKDALAKENFSNIDIVASKLLFGSSLRSASLVVRQYLYVRCLGIDFNKALLYSIGSGKPIRAPLPKAWRVAIAQYGYKVDHVTSKFLWVIFLLIYYLYGVYRAFSIVIVALLSGFKISDFYDIKYSYFNNLSPLNVPSENGCKESKNIITWYASWRGRNNDVQGLYHDSVNSDDVRCYNFTVRYAPLNEMGLGIGKPLANFLTWFFYALAVSAKDLFLSRWWTFLLFEQYVQAARQRFMHQRMIAKDYLLHNSGWVYRPIWTYEAENRGARVIFYFYSTNCDEFKTVNGYVTTTAGWQLASWPHVLVWNQYQKRFVNRSFYSSERVDVVGPIWFSSSDKLELLPRSNYNSKKAAIFDVQPHRSSRYQTLGLITEYYDSSVAIQFLKDIDSVLIEFNIVALYKRKRDIGDILHPKYKYTLKRLQRNNSFNIDPNLSAYDLISESDLVISMPFTSTAILARDQKKSSIYYDPFGYVARDDRAAHGIPIIIGIDELRLWIYRALN